MKQVKHVILAARIVSMIFTPFYLPFMGMVILFVFSYLSLFPWAYKLQVLTMVYRASGAWCHTSSPSFAISRVYM